MQASRGQGGGKEGGGGSRALLAHGGEGMPTGAGAGVTREGETREGEVGEGGMD